MRDLSERIHSLSIVEGGEKKSEEAIKKKNSKSYRNYYFVREVY